MSQWRRSWLWCEMANNGDDLREFFISLDSCVAQVNTALDQYDVNSIERIQRRLEEHLRLLNIFISLVAAEVSATKHCYDS